MGLTAVTIALAAVIFVLQGISKHLGEISAALQRQPVQVEPRRVTVGEQRDAYLRAQGVLPEAMGTPGDD